MTKATGETPMLNRLSENIADFIFSQGCFERKLLPVYSYGISLFISSLLGVVLVLSAGILTGNFLKAVLFLLAFIFLRLYTGGLHFNSFILCNTITTLTFLAALTAENFISQLKESNIVYSAFMLFSVTVTLTLSPVSHPNKPLSFQDKRRFRLISALILLAHYLLYTILKGIIGTEIIIVTDFISSAYIIIGLLKNTKERRDFDET